MQSFLAAIAALFTKDMIRWVTQLITQAISNYQATQAAKKQAKENLDAYKQAIQSGDKDAEAKAAQDLLNNSSH